MLLMLIKVREGNADQPLALAVDDDGLIAMLDAQKQVQIDLINQSVTICPLKVLEQFKDSHFAQVLDAKGCAVTPGEF